MRLSKRHITTLSGKLAIILCFFFLQGSSPSGTHTLTVKITRLKHSRGVVEIGLYNKESAFPEVGKQYKKARVKIDGNTATYKFKGLKNGDYAIATYHDENGDKSCNTNMFGVPTEAYAFSRNIRPFLSAPKYNSCRFWVTKDRTLYIRMIY